MPQRRLFSLCVADPAVTLGQFFFHLLGLVSAVVKRIKLFIPSFTFSTTTGTEETFYKYLWNLVFRKRTKIGNSNEVTGPLQKVLSNARGEGIIA